MSIPSRFWNGSGELSKSVTFGDGAWLRPAQFGPGTIMRAGAEPATLEAVLATLDRLIGDEYIDFMRAFYREGLRRFGNCWGYNDQLTILQAAAGFLKPERYLEIGVFRGRSMSVVGAAAPNCAMYGFDMWLANYSGLQNVGPELVREQLQRAGHHGEVILTSGSSHETVPAFFRDHPAQQFDLITVDGDHSDEGARRDLQHVIPHLRIGGVLVFDDICHPLHPALEEVWDVVVGMNPNFVSMKYTEVGHGIAVAVRVMADPEFDRLYAPGDSARSLIRQVQELTAKISEQQSLIEHLQADRAARLEVIDRQGAELGRIPGLEADIEYLKQQLSVCEADRAARLEVIDRQGAELGRIPGLEADIERLKRKLAAKK